MCILFQTSKPRLICKKAEGRTRTVIRIKEASVYKVLTRDELGFWEIGRRQIQGCDQETQGFASVEQLTLLGSLRCSLLFVCARLI